MQLGFSGAVLPLIEAPLVPPVVIRGLFLGRVNVSTTATNARITFSSLDRTYTGSYDFVVLDTLGAIARAQLKLIVQCKYKPQHPSSCLETDTLLQR